MKLYKWYTWGQEDPDISTGAYESKEEAIEDFKAWGYRDEEYYLYEITLKPIGILKNDSKISTKPFRARSK